MGEKRRSGGACTRRGKQRWEPRKKIRLPADAYLAGEPFLLTVCTAGRQELLTEAKFGAQAHEALAPSADKTRAELWCAVVMPDHVHLLLSALEGKSPLDTAACFKRLTTVAVRQLGFAKTLWQRRIHDRGLRAAFNNDLDVAVRYVLDNPVRRGLVDSWDDWPLSYLHQDVAESL